MAVKSLQPTVYCVITFFLLSSYIDTVDTVQTVHIDDGDNFSGESNAAEFRALIHGTMDIESTTWTMTCSTMTAAAVLR